MLPVVPVRRAGNEDYGFLSRIMVVRGIFGARVARLVAPDDQAGIS
jgi:hypothetical protein